MAAPRTLAIGDIHFVCSVLQGEARAIESKEIAWLQVRELQASEFPRANRELISEIQSLHAS